MRLVDHGLVFLSIQKTGSTAVRHFFEANCNVIQPTNSHLSKQQLLSINYAKSTDLFVGVIREPLERQLSRYLYHCKIGVYKSGSIKHFRSIIHEGEGCLPDYKRAIDYGADQWMLYDTLAQDLDVLCSQFNIDAKRPLMHENVTGSVKTDQWMVGVFYDPPTRQLATTYHQQDIDIIEEIKFKKSSPFANK